MSVLVAAIQTIVTVILTALLGYVAALLKQHGDGRKEDAQRQKAVQDAITIVLQLVICDMHDRYVEMGYITKVGYDRFNNVYTIYHDSLGGNGLGTKMKEEIDKLPIR